ncbi:MAG: sulfide/dihydroorotate dehydrogenase-like FAD/NAD-binding protein [Thermoanaerobaculia bacterium]
MNRILKKEVFSPVTFLWEVEAPDVAKAALPGHFVIVRHKDKGERIPLTIADFDREKGTITLVIQALGKTTKEMMALKEGDFLLNLAGPLGIPSHIEKVGTVVMVGGGLGVAPVFPQLRAFKEKGNYTISIIGFRSKDLIFWEEKFRNFSDELIVTTDDGSYGRKGLVSEPLKEILQERKVDLVVAIGPAIMMKVCSEVTKPFGVKTIVSLNTIMVDGTGMCGSCRVTVGGQTKFACVDGPDFDGHLIDWNELMRRQRRFEREEKVVLKEYEEKCKLEEKGVKI